MNTLGFSALEVLLALEHVDEECPGWMAERFQRTWLASHIWLATVQLDEMAPPPVWAAWLLARNPAADLAPGEWLPGAAFQTVPADDIQNMLEQGLEDLAEAGLPAGGGMGKALGRKLLEPVEWAVAVDAAICCCSHCVCVPPMSWRVGAPTAAVKPAASKPLAVKKRV